MKNNLPAEIFLVEDNLGDIVLVEEAFRASGINHNLNVFKDGEEALNFLKHRESNLNVSLPDLILLDLNLPRKSGKEVLQEVKSDNNLEIIPVVILTSSQNEDDILECYRLKANSYITKPVDFYEFVNVVKTIQSYWMTTVTLPPKSQNL